jgi:hypothetical protein
METIFIILVILMVEMKIFVFVFSRKFREIFFTFAERKFSRNEISRNFEKSERIFAFRENEKMGFRFSPSTE